MKKYALIFLTVIVILLIISKSAQKKREVDQAIAEAKQTMNQMTAIADSPQIDSAPSSPPTEVAENNSQPVVETTQMAQVQKPAQLSDQKVKIVKRDGKITAFQTEKIRFKWDSVEIDERSHETLQDLASLLAQVEKIRVEGHTDNSGDPLYNKYLSEERAKSVALFLEKAGVPQHKLEFAGFGDESPLADNATLEGRATNRRVEFKVVD